MVMVMNMINFRTSVLEIATQLDKQYSVVNLFLDDKELFSFNHMINLDEKIG
jgi:hypothetical protein